jgi:hypothetical protein
MQPRRSTSAVRRLVSKAGELFTPIGEAHRGPAGARGVDAPRDAIARSTGHPARWMTSQSARGYAGDCKRTRSSVRLFSPAAFGFSRAVLFRSLARRACWFVFTFPGRKAIGVSPPDPRLGQRTTVRSGTEFPTHAPSTWLTICTRPSAGQNMVEHGNEVLPMFSRALHPPDTAGNRNSEAGNRQPRNQAES